MAGRDEVGAEACPNRHHRQPALGLTFGSLLVNYEANVHQQVPVPVLEGLRGRWGEESAEPWVAGQRRADAELSGCRLGLSATRPTPRAICPCSPNCPAQWPLAGNRELVGFCLPPQASSKALGCRGPDGGQTPPRIKELPVDRRTWPGRQTPSARWHRTGWALMAGKSRRD